MKLIFCGKNINMTYGKVYTIHKNWSGSLWTINDIGDKYFFNNQSFVDISEWRALNINKVLNLDKDEWEQKN